MTIFLYSYHFHSFSATICTNSGLQRSAGIEYSKSYFQIWRRSLIEQAFIYHHKTFKQHTWQNDCIRCSFTSSLKMMVLLDKTWLFINVQREKVLLICGSTINCACNEIIIDNTSLWTEYIETITHQPVSLIWDSKQPNNA